MERVLSPETREQLRHVPRVSPIIRPSQIADKQVRARIEAADKAGRCSMVSVGPILGAELDAAFREHLADAMRRAGEEEEAQRVLASDASLTAPEELEAVEHGATSYPETRAPAPASEAEQLPATGPAAERPPSPYNPASPTWVGYAAWWQYFSRVAGHFRGENKRAQHACHAHGCAVLVSPRLLMCSRHWMMVPSALKALVWSTYVPGQEVRKDPSREYLDAATAAIDAVRKAEDEQAKGASVPGVHDGPAVPVRGNEAGMPAATDRVMGVRRRGRARKAESAPKLPGM